MKTGILLSLFILIGCAHQRSPASLKQQDVAKDSIALGNVKASATRSIESKKVCFDIVLDMKGVEQKDAMASNWTVAWIDKDSKYHLLNLSNRVPASLPQGGTKVVPYGHYQEWSNTFRTCAPTARMEDVKTLILTPKELPYRESEGLKLEWN